MVWHIWCAFGNVRKRQRWKRFYYGSAGVCVYVCLNRSQNRRLSGALFLITFDILHKILNKNRERTIYTKQNEAGEKKKDRNFIFYVSISEERKSLGHIVHLTTIHSTHTYTWDTLLIWIEKLLLTEICEPFFSMFLLPRLYLTSFHSYCFSYRFELASEKRFVAFDDSLFMKKIVRLSKLFFSYKLA